MQPEAGIEEEEDSEKAYDDEDWDEDDEQNEGIDSNNSRIFSIKGKNLVSIERMWTESFRPKTLDEVVGQTEIVERLKQFVRRVDFPHMLFSGPPGVGKTTCAEAIVNGIYSPAERSSNVKFLNASDSFLPLNPELISGAQTTKSQSSGTSLL